MSGSKLMADIDNLRRSLEGLKGKIPSTSYNAILASVSGLYQTGYEVVQKSAQTQPAIPTAWLKRAGSLIYEYPVFQAEFSKAASNAALSTHWDDLCNGQNQSAEQLSRLRRLFRNMCGFSIGLIDLNWAIRYAEAEISEQLGQLILERAAVAIQEAVLSLSRAEKKDIFICRYKRPNVLAVLVRSVDLELLGQAFDSANAQMIPTHFHPSLFHTSFAYSTCDMVEAQGQYSSLSPVIRRSVGSRELCPNIMLAMVESYLLLSGANDGMLFLSDLDVLKEDFYLRSFSTKERKSFEHAVSQYEQADISRDDRSMRAIHVRDECFQTLLIGLVPEWVSEIQRRLRTDPDNQVLFMQKHLLSEIYNEWFPFSSRNLVVAK